MRGGGCQTPPRVSSTGYWGPSSESDPLFWWLQCDFSPSGLNETAPNIPTRGRLGPWKHELRKLGSTAGAAAFSLAPAVSTAQRASQTPTRGLRAPRWARPAAEAGRRRRPSPERQRVCPRSEGYKRARRLRGVGTNPEWVPAPQGSWQRVVSLPRAGTGPPGSAPEPVHRGGPRGTSGRPPWSHLPTPFQGHRGPHSGQAAPPPRPGFQPRPPAERRAVPRPGSATPTVGGRQPADPASEGGRAPPGRGSPRRRPQPRAPPGPAFHRPGHARHAQATPRRIDVSLRQSEAV